MIHERTNRQYFTVLIELNTPIEMDFLVSEENNASSHLLKSEFTTNITLTEQYLIWSDVFGSLTLLGIIGNVIMLLSLCRMKLKFFTTIVVGLSMSDLISATNSPFMVYIHLQHDGYIGHWMMCVFPYPVDIATSMVTVHQVFLLSVIRFRGVVQRHDSSVEFSPEKCLGYIACSYVFSFTMTVILSAFIIEIGEFDGRYLCSMKFDQSLSVEILSILYITIGMFIPMILIVLSCIAIFIVIAHRKYGPSSTSIASHSQKRQRHVLIQLAVIAVSFLIGYTSDYATKVLSQVYRQELDGDNFTCMVLASHGVLRVTECLNPVLYYYASDNIKKETISLWEDFMRLVGFRARVMQNSAVVPVTAVTTDLNQ